MLNNGNVSTESNANELNGVKGGHTGALSKRKTDDTGLRAKRRRARELGRPGSINVKGGAASARGPRGGP